MKRLRAVESNVAVAAGAVIHLELEEMASAVAIIEASGLQTPNPFFVALISLRLPIQPDVASSGTHSVAGDARPIGLAHHRHSEPAVHHVVPGIQLRHRIGVSAR